jgi:predicted double-glycine peptidase
MKFKTKLWKRSKKSFATTIPHIVLLTMDENKHHDVVWEFNKKLGKWTMELKEKKR